MSVKVRDRKLYGRSSSDIKSGVAAFVAACIALADRLPGRPAQKDRHGDIREIGRVLGTRYVPEGTFAGQQSRKIGGGAVDQQRERRPCPSLLSRAATTFQTSAVRDSDCPMRDLATCIALLTA